VQNSCKQRGAQTVRRVRQRSAKEALTGFVRNSAVGYARAYALCFESLQRIGDDLNCFNDLLCSPLRCGTVLVLDLFRVHDSFERAAERDDVLPDAIRRPLVL
jgi:hypothetical protein